MSTKLISLVQAADDPIVLLYVINNLGQGVSNRACFANTVQSMRLDAMRSLVSGRWQINRMRNDPTKELWIRKQLETIEDRIMPALLDRQERQLTALLFQQASLSIFLDKLVTASLETLQKQLKSNNILIRLVAVSAVGRRHLHLEDDLIERLGDPQPAVQEAAHKALICVARGTDFGPVPGASQRSIERAIERWKYWLALQQGASPQTLAKEAAIAAAGKQTKPAPLEIVPFILVDDASKERQDKQK